LEGNIPDFTDQTNLKIMLVWSQNPKYGSNFFFFFYEEVNFSHSTTETNLQSRPAQKTS